MDPMLFIQIVDKYLLFLKIGGFGGGNNTYSSQSIVSFFQLIDN
jgi:hypothetical protein